MPAAKPAYPRLRRGHPLAQGLVGAWPLYEGSGLNANDLSGNDNTGTLTNGPTWVADQQGWALSFTGASSQYVNCGTPLAGQTLTTFTLAGWMYRSSTSNLCVFGWGDTMSRRANILWFTDGNVYWQIETGQTNFPNCAFNVTGWHHFCMVFNSALANNSRIAGYIDGAAKTLSNPQIVNAYTVTGNLRIGAEQGDSRYSTGRHDAVQLYNRVLTSDEVAALYADSYQMYRRPSWRLKAAAGGVTHGLFRQNPLTGLGGGGQFFANPIG